MTLRLYLHAPQTLFAARVNQSAYTYPLAQVTFDGVTVGSYTDIPVGATVVFGSTPGNADLGRQRVRKAATSSILYFGRSSQGSGDGEVDLADDIYITVHNEFRVWSKIPFIDIDDLYGSGDSGVVYKDADLTVGTYTTNPPPVANTGTPYAGTIDPDTGLITVDFDAVNSFATADGASITDYLWDVDDGTITAGGATAQQMEATFPAGFRYVSLTVTDSNGNSHTARVPVYARDPDADTTTSAFQITSHRITPQGQTVSVLILEDIPIGDGYFNGMLVIVMDGEPVDSTDRSNILFWGWHQQDMAVIAAGKYATLRDVTLACLDVAGRLDTLPGFPQTVESADTPDTWLEMASPNMDKYLHYLLQWHSTALESADYFPSNTGDSYPFTILASDGESLYDQVNRRAQSMVPDHLFTCNRFGQLAIIVDPMLQDIADRTGSVQATLTAADWSNLRYVTKRPPGVHWLRGNAIIASATEVSAAFCIAPGEAPGQGEMAQDHGEQLAISQADLNSCTGHRYARLNARQGPLSITLPTSDDLGLDPAALTWVELTIPADVAAQRGLSFTEERGLPKGVTVRYEYRRESVLRTVELMWEREVSGTPAVTVTPTPAAHIPDPPPTYDPGGGGYVEPPPAGTTPLGNTVFVLTGKVLGRTNNFNDASPNWVSIAPAWASGKDWTDFALDPWAPSTTGYLSRKDSLFKSTDLNAVTPTWTEVYDSGDVSGATGGSVQDNASYQKILCSPNQQDYVVWMYVANVGTRAYCAESEDGGATWSTFYILDAGTGSKLTAAGCSDIVPRTVGASLSLFMGDSASDSIYRSSDKGLAWGFVHALPDNLTSVRCLHVPPDDNDDDGNIILYLGAGTNSGTHRVYRSLDSGITYTALNGNRGIGPKRGGIESYTADRQKMFWWEYIFNGATTGILWTSDDAGDTWTQAACSGLIANIQGAWGWPYSEQRIYAVGIGDTPISGTPSLHGIWLTEDRGATFVDKTGDWAFGFAYPSGVSGYASGAVIVADWTS